MSYSDFQAVLFRWGMRREEAYKGEASVCCFSPLPSPFRKGVCYINTIRSWGWFHLSEEEEGRRKSLQTTKDQNVAVLITLLQLSNMNYRANTVLYCSIIRFGLQFSIISKFLWYHLEKGKCGSRKLPRTRIGLFLGCTVTLIVVSKTKRWSEHGYS